MPRTTVVGQVLAPDGSFAAGIPVQLFGIDDTALTQANGAFAISNARARVGMVVEASGELGGNQNITGQSLPATGVVDGLTDVGTIFTVEVASALPPALIDPDNDPDFGPHIATPLADDTIFGPFSLANPVNWFGQLYSEFFVGMNGWVSFTPPAGNVSPFPSTNQFFNVTPWISLNFKDWFAPCQDGNASATRTVTYRDSPDLFVVTFNKTCFLGRAFVPGNRNTFQLQVDNNSGEWQLLWGIHSDPNGLVGWKGETAPGSVINAGGVPTALGSVFTTRMADQTRFENITVVEGVGIRSVPDVDAQGDPVFRHEVIQHSTGPGELFSVTPPGITVAAARRLPDVGVLVSHGGGAGTGEGTGQSGGSTDLEGYPEYSKYDGPTGTVRIRTTVQGVPQANAKVCFVLWDHPQFEANTFKKRTDADGYVTFENVPLGCHLSDWAAIDPADGRQKDVFNDRGSFSKIIPCIQFEGQEIFMVNDGFSIGPTPGVPKIQLP